MGEPTGISATPTPTDEEMAAILAAYEGLWPRPAEIDASNGMPRWRFAGRWWSARPRFGGWS